MQPRAPSICFLWEHFVLGVDLESLTGQPVCRAFPEGIPSRIINGVFDHREPFQGETILFRWADDASQEDVEAWEQEVVEIEKREMLPVIQQFQ